MGERTDETRLAVIEEEVKKIPDYFRELKQDINGIGVRLKTNEDKVIGLETKMEVVLMIFKWTFAPVFSLAGISFLFTIGYYLLKK